MAGGMMRSCPEAGRRNVGVAAVENVVTTSTNQETQETTGRTTRAMARAAG